MNFRCPPAPVNKREYISDIGKILVKKYGKKKYYKPQEVKKAHQKSNWNNYDFSCWAMSTFSTHSDFDIYHKKTGEECDYSAMKAEMLRSISSAESANLTALPKEDMDASWLDWGAILTRIGDFFGNIADTADTSDTVHTDSSDMDIDIDSD